MVQAVDERLMREWSISEVNRVLSNKLNPRERDVLRLRYMASDNRKRTLDEIGFYYGVSREKIRQIEKKAISKIKKDFANIINEVEF